MADATPVEKTARVPTEVPRSERTPEEIAALVASGDAILIRSSGARIGVGEEGNGEQDAVAPHPDYQIQHKPADEVQSP